MRYLWILLAFFIASPAFGQAAAAWNTECDGTGNTEHIVREGGMVCFFFDGLGANPSDVLTCGSTTCRVHFDPIDSAESDTGATATVWVRACADTEDCTDNQAPRVHDAVLTGLQGADGTQRFTVRVGRGPFKIEVVNDGAPGDNPTVTVWGE